MASKKKYRLDDENDLKEVLQMLTIDDDNRESDIQSDEETDTDSGSIFDENEGHSNVSTDEDDYNSEEDEDALVDEENYYIGQQKRNGKVIESWKWKKTPIKVSKRAPHNILTHLPCVKNAAKNVNTAVGSWNLLIDESILQMIVDYTNQYIATIRDHFSRPRDARDTDLTEIKAFIGVLYLSGIYKANHLCLEELWSKNGDGVELFRLVMGLKRFRFLLRCLRFDNRETRQDRKKLDRLAAIRNFFDQYVANCQKCYSPFENLTIDEMLVAFKGRCCFRQYIPSKPARYGIKIFSLVDSRLYYTFNLEVYVGTQPEGPFSVSNKATDVVKRLVKPVVGSGRNITCDNWFTDYNLALELKQMKLSLVGTLKKNKPQIPINFKNNNGDEHSSLFGYQKDCTLVSYVPKKKKTVVLLSSLHLDGTIDEATGDQKKPEIITFYNSTKGGVDTVDQMCSFYSVSRATKRWPMVVFFSILNTAGINSQIIYTSNKNKVKSRRAFLRLLSRELIADQLQKRLQKNTGLPLAISLVLKRQHSQIASTSSANSSEDSGIRKACMPCKFEKRRRLSKYSCYVCNTNLCLQHCKMKCFDECQASTNTDDESE